MGLTEKKQRDMKLLSRKRVSLILDNEGATPSRKSLIKQVASKYKVNEDQVVIKHVYSQFGKQKTKLIVHIYDDKDKMGMFEHKNLLKKHVTEPKEKKTEESAAPAKSEESAEEAVEEAAEESVEESVEEAVEEVQEKPEDKSEE
ncbi:hypothetical protein JXC34_02630 [Candidatus Woesearchaeota archaeon]|nr:hypothetical protein [Candidatus Woesearchaeota archaeon]